MTRTRYTLDEIDSYMETADRLKGLIRSYTESAKDQMRLMNQYSNAFLKANKRHVNKSLQKDLLYAEICRNLFKSIMFRLSENA